jgi:hypothetical protein
MRKICNNILEFTAMASHGINVIRSTPRNCKYLKLNRFVKVGPLFKASAATPITEIPTKLMEIQDQTVPEDHKWFISAKGEFGSKRGRADIASAKVQNTSQKLFTSPSSLRA